MIFWVFYHSAGVFSTILFWAPAIPGVIMVPSDLFAEVHRQMEKCCVSREYVALWFSTVVPDSRGAAAAIRRALRCEGLEPWPEAEAELFSRAGGTLLIAHPRSNSTLRADTTG